MFITLLSLEERTFVNNFIKAFIRLIGLKSEVKIGAFNLGIRAINDELRPFGIPPDS